MPLNKIKLVIITGNKYRHYWFAEQLAKVYDVSGVIMETKRYPAMEEHRSLIVDNHINKRDLVEKKYFKKNYDKSFENKIKKLETGQSNSQNTFNWVKRLQPDFIVLYGSGIIKDPLLSYFDKKIINIHLGLSPYYRGTATNFWPLVNNEPECVGATIHLAVARVDAGPILMQVRPEMEINDTIHDIGFKVIIAGAKAMSQVIEKYYNNKIKQRIQSKEELRQGKLYKRSDFNEAAIEKMIKNFNCGMIRKYLKNKKARDKKYPIIN